MPFLLTKLFFQNSGKKFSKSKSRKTAGVQEPVFFPQRWCAAPLLKWNVTYFVGTLDIGWRFCKFHVNSLGLYPPIAVLWYCRTVGFEVPYSSFPTNGAKDQGDFNWQKPGPICSNFTLQCEDWGHSFPRNKLFFWDIYKRNILTKIIVYTCINIMFICTHLYIYI